MSWKGENGVPGVPGINQNEWYKAADVLPPNNALVVFYLLGIPDGLVVGYYNSQMRWVRTHLGYCGQKDENSLPENCVFKITDRNKKYLRWIEIARIPEKLRDIE